MARSIDFLPKETIHGRLLPWVVGVMVFLSGLALVLGLGLQALTSGWKAGLENSLTVQIIGPDQGVRDQEAEAALAVLQDWPGVENASRMPVSDIEGLLEPWLGSGSVPDALPVPVLIEVSLVPGTQIDLVPLSRQIRTVAPSARIDGHDRWLDDLRVLARLVQGVSAVILGLIVLATITVIVFATRAGLAAQRDAVAIVHLIGAEDRQIAGAFQRRFLLVGIQGALLGLAGLGALFLAAYTASEIIQTDMLPSLLPPTYVFYALLLLPLPAALITMLTARFTVKRALGDMN